MPAETKLTCLQDTGCVACREHQKVEGGRGTLARSLRGAWSCRQPGPSPVVPRALLQVARPEAISATATAPRRGCAVSFHTT